MRTFGIRCLSSLNKIDLFYFYILHQITSFKTIPLRPFSPKNYLKRYFPYILIWNSSSQVKNG